MEKYSVLPSLSRKFFEQLPAGALLLYLVMEFVDVVTHGHQEDLGKNLLVAAEKKLAETVNPVRRKILCKLEMAWSKTEAHFSGFALQIRAGDWALTTTIRGHSGGMRALA